MAEIPYQRDLPTDEEEEVHEVTNVNDNDNGVALDEGNEETNTENETEDTENNSNSIEDAKHATLTSLLLPLLTSPNTPPMSTDDLLPTTLMNSSSIHPESSLITPLLSGPNPLFKYLTSGYSFSFQPLYGELSVIQEDFMNSNPLSTPLLASQLSASSSYQVLSEFHNHSTGTVPSHIPKNNPNPSADHLQELRAQFQKVIDDSISKVKQEMESIADAYIENLSKSNSMMPDSSFHDRSGSQQTSQAPIAYKPSLTVKADDDDGDSIGDLTSPPSPAYSLAFTPSSSFSVGDYRQALVALSPGKRVPLLFDSAVPLHPIANNS